MRIGWLILAGVVLVLISVNPMFIIAGVIVAAMVFLFGGMMNGDGNIPTQARQQPDRVNLMDNRLYASYRQETPGTISSYVKRDIHNRQHGRCAHPGCGHSFNLELHHIRPKQYGGTDDIRNLVYLCPNHHRFAHEQIQRRRAS